MKRVIYSLLFLSAAAYMHSQILLNNWIVKSSQTDYTEIKKQGHSIDLVTVKKTRTVVYTTHHGDTIFERTEVVDETLIAGSTETSTIQSLTAISYSKMYYVNNALKIDSIFMGTNYIDKIESRIFEEKPAKFKITLPYRVLYNKALAYTRPQKRQVFEEAVLDDRDNAGHSFVGVSYMPSVAYRQIRIHNAQFENNGLLNSRTASEKARYGQSIGIMSGYNLCHKHLFYLEGTYSVQGFKTNDDSINWQTGKPMPDSLRMKTYTFFNYTIGSGYSFRNYDVDSHIGFAADIGMYYTVQGGYSNSTFKNEGQLFLEKNRFGFKAGLGIVVKPNYRHEIKIMPTLRYDLSPVYKSDLTTRLYNVGLTISYGVNFGKFQK